MTTKANISKKVAKEINITKSKAADFTKTFFKLISNAIESKNVKIKNFGTFERKISVKRIGRNPKTKECYIIEPRRRLFFKASNKLKKGIN